MKKNIAFLLVIFFTSCSSMQIIENGTYNWIGKKYNWAGTKYYHKYVLTLYENHTFHLIEFPFKVSCEGNWNYVDKNTIKIACFPPQDGLEPFTRGYMHERARILKVKRNNKLKMSEENNTKRKHVILKKVREEE